MPTNVTPKRKPSRAPKLEFAVQYGVRSLQLPSQGEFRKWVRAALAGASRITRGAHLTLRVIGAREARLLNRRFRNRDYATNVLTFVYPVARRLEGDIAICAPVVAREARACAISREAHYAHLTVHALLHLQGHDHQRTRDAERMERLEARILAQLGYADPYRLPTRGTGTRAEKSRPRASRKHEK